MRERRVILLCLVLLATTATPARADDQFRLRPTAGGPPLLEASGEGSVSVPPDLATFSLGVVTQAATAREAAEENARKMTAVVQALTRLGVTGKDVRTQTISLSPVTETRPNEAPRIRGYRATNQVEATTRDLARVGEILDDVVQAGANLTGNVRFGLSDQSTAQTAALRQATREALARATAMAEAIGKRLTRVVDIRAADVAVPRPLGMEPLAMARSATTPVETGELTIQARVILRAEFQ